MGLSARLGPWPIRAVLAVLVFATIFMQAETGAKVGVETALARADGVLKHAGFSVARHQQRWLDGKIAGRSMLVASNPACGTPMTVWSLATGESADTAQIGFRTPPMFFFGRWSGGAPPRPMILLQSIIMRLRYALSLGHAAPPPSAMIAVDDPSACLALASVDWSGIWYD